MKRILAMGVVGLCLVTAVRAQEGLPHYLPGKGVRDAAGKVGYWPAKTGGVDAVSLENGKVLWSSKEADQPLLALGDRVVAQALVKGKPNQIRLVVLDSDKVGKKVVESKPIVLPEWVSVAATYGRSFQSGVQLDKGEAALCWTARGWYAGGAAPPPQVLKAAMKNAEGWVRFNLETGAFTMVKGEVQAKKTYLQEIAQAKVGTRVLSSEDMQGDDPNNRFQQKRLVKMTEAGGQVVWQHEIAAPVFMPPPP